MSELSAWLVAIGFIVLFLAYKWLQDEYLESKGNGEFKTALCVRGKFYYVVPESEYVELTRCKRIQDKISKHFLEAEAYNDKHEADRKSGEANEDSL